MSVWQSAGVASWLTVVFVIWWAVSNGMDDKGKLQNEHPVVGVIGLICITIVFIAALVL